jgi:hypothetical protein
MNNLHHIVALSLAAMTSMTAAAAELRGNPAAAVQSAQSPRAYSDCIVANAQRNTLNVEKKEGQVKDSFEVRVKNIVDGALIEAFLADVLPEKTGSAVRVYVDPGVLAPEKMQTVLLQGC